MNTQLESRINTLKDSLQEGGRTIKDHAQHARIDGARLIRRDPYTAMILATLAGVVLGALLAYLPRSNR